MRPVGITTVGLAVRIAAATTVSYLLAQEVSGSEFVLFAPVTTLLVVQGSPFATLGASMQRVFGTGLGVLIATIYVQLLPSNALTFGVAILAALLVARLLPVSLGAQLQIPVAVVFVLALGAGGLEQDVWRVLDVVIGGMVGVVAVYAWPSRPDLEPVELAAAEFHHALTDQLRAIGAEMGTLPEALPSSRKHAFTVSSRGLRVTATAARDAYATATNAVRLHPRAKRALDRLAELGDRIGWLSGLAIQIRAISGAVDRLYDRPGLEPSLDPSLAHALLDSCAELIDAVADGATDVEDRAEVIRTRVAFSLDAISADRLPVAEVLQSVSLLGRIDLLVDSTLRPLSAAQDDADDGEESDGAAGR